MSTTVESREDLESILRKMHIREGVSMIRMRAMGLYRRGRHDEAAVIGEAVKHPDGLVISPLFDRRYLTAAKTCAERGWLTQADEGAPLKATSAGRRVLARERKRSAEIEARVAAETADFLRKMGVSPPETDHDR